MFFRQLVDFYREHGHVDVPDTSKVLRRWVMIQRDQYLRKCKRLTGTDYTSCKQSTLNGSEDERLVTRAAKSVPRLQEEGEDATLEHVLV
jgi:hypothetical protein